MPKWLLSLPPQARSGRRGRDDLRADPVGPVVVRNEIAPRPAQHRKLQRAQKVQDVAAEPPVVAQSRALVEQAAVYAPPEVFDKAPEDAPVEVDQRRWRGVDGNIGGLRSPTRRPVRFLNGQRHVNVHPLTLQQRWRELSRRRSRGPRMGLVQGNVPPLVTSYFLYVQGQQTCVGPSVGRRYKARLRPLGRRQNSPLPPQSSPSDCLGTLTSRVLGCKACRERCERSHMGAASLRRPGTNGFPPVAIKVGTSWRVSSRRPERAPDCGAGQANRGERAYRVKRAYRAAAIHCRRRHYRSSFAPDRFSGPQ